MMLFEDWKLSSASVEDLNAYSQATNSTLGDLQSQIDGNITTWFYAYEPTASNEPASLWTTTDEKNNHLGDLFYDTNTGYAYRWQLVSTVYSWAILTDTDVTKALADAAKAQDTADSKRRNFTAQPVPPYDVGDLWSQGTGGELMRCITARAEGASYNAADWEKASKYTDDTLAQEAKDDAATADGKAVNAQSTANAASTAASNAQSTADSAASAAATAQSTADTANDNLATLAGITGRIIYSSSPPTGDDANANNLWIDTDDGKLYTYTTSWELVTDSRLTAAASAATAAQSTADSAASAASDAQTTADGAATAAAAAQSAADTADAKAVAAQTAADNAQATADSANSDLLTLAGKTGRILHQETAPTGDDANSNNLWLKDSTGQPYSWNGSSWELITDSRITAAATAADNAQDAADGAQSTADSASSAASAAQSTADDAATAAANAQADATAAQTFRCSSNTAGGTAAKVPASSVPGFTLHDGVTIAVKFTYANSAANPTFEVDGTGAHAIMVDGVNAGYWRPGSTVLLTYDGTYWQATVPIYGSNSTIGNPNAGNVYTDDNGIDIRDGSTVLARIRAALIELGKNATTAVIKLCGGTGEIGVISGMLVFFAEKIGIKGNSEADILASGTARLDATSSSDNAAGCVAESSNSDSDTSAILYASRTAGSVTNSASLQPVANDTDAWIAMEGPLRKDYDGADFLRRAHFYIRNDGETPAEIGTFVRDTPDVGTPRSASMYTWANSSGSGVAFSGDTVNVNGHQLRVEKIYNAPIYLGTVGSYTSNISLSFDVTFFDFLLVNGAAAVNGTSYQRVSIVIAVSDIHYYQSGDLATLSYFIGAFQSQSVYVSGYILFTSSTTFRASLDAASGWNQLKISDIYGIKLPY